jgi:vacuolar-type H+-ATPase subunit I/STV1
MEATLNTEVAMSPVSELSYDEKVQVRGLLRKILDHTNSTNLSSTEHSVDDYIHMVESRQALFDELAMLDPESQKVSRNALPRRESNDALDAEIKSIVQQIVKREEHHNSKVAGMMEDLRKALKELSNEKSINAVYVKDGYESGAYFNSKN